MAELTLENGYYNLPARKLVNLVTCLEMVVPPARQAVHWPEGVSLKRLGAADLATHRALFKSIGQDLMWFSRLIMLDEKLAGILADPGIESFALMQGREAVGMLELNFKEQPDCELAFFGLVPSLVGKGFGRMLMHEALNRAWEKPIERFWVHTCHYDHPKALSFYQQAGFRPYKLMIEVHDDPRLTAHLPLSAAPHVPLLKR